MKTNYTDTQLQAAIDEACNEVAQSAIGFLNTLDLDPQSKVWAEETPARLHLIEAALAALPEPMDEESMLLNLLAVIHRDGGHYQAEHGTRKAVEDACKEWQRLILIAEKTGLTEPKQSLSQIRPLAEAGDVPEGCVRYYTYKKDGEWTTKSKYRAMQDTHYIDTRLPESAEKPEPLVAEHKALTADEWAARWQAEVDARNRQYNELECTRAIAEKALTKLAKTKENGLSQLRPIAEADDVPEGCVRVTAFCVDGEWIIDSKGIHPGDTHFADIRLPESDPLVAEHKALPEWKPQVGDVVTLKSGGPKMTVVKLADTEGGLLAFLCEWFSDSGEYDSGVIYLTSLQPA